MELNRIELIFFIKIVTYKIQSILNENKILEIKRNNGTQYAGLLKATSCNWTELSGFLHTLEEGQSLLYVCVCVWSVTLLVITIF